MTTLSELMRTATDTEPEGLAADPGALATAGRARLRRRRTAVALAAAVAVALGVTPLVVRATQRPGPATSPWGPVLHLGRALPAVPGSDYTLQGTVTRGMLRAGPGHLAALAPLPDGRVVVSREEGRGKRQHSAGNGLLDPATGRTTWFPARQVGAYLGHDGTLLVYGTPDIGQNAPDHPYEVYDVSTGTWRALPSDPSIDMEWGGSLQNQVVSGGMLYVSMDTTPTSQLWRVPLDGSGGWQRVANVGTFAVGDGVLAYTEHGRHGVTAVRLRDLATGRERSVATPSTRGCGLAGLSASARYVVLQLACAEPGFGWPDHLLVLDGQGRPLATVAAGYLELSYVSGDALVFSVPQGPDNLPYADALGAFVYHPATHRLVRLSGRAAVMGPVTPLQTNPVLRWRTTSRHLLTGPPGTAAFDVVAVR